MLGHKARMLSLHIPDSNHTSHSQSRTNLNGPFTPNTATGHGSQRQQAQFAAFPPANLALQRALMASTGSGSISVASGPRSAGPFSGHQRFASLGGGGPPLSPASWAMNAPNTTASGGAFFPPLPPGMPGGARLRPRGAGTGHVRRESLGPPPKAVLGGPKAAATSSSTATTSSAEPPTKGASIASSAEATPSTELPPNVTPLKRKKPVVVKLPRTNLAAEDETERPLWVARVASAEDLEVVSEAIAEEPETFGREISPGELEDQQSELMTLEVYLPGKRFWSIVIQENLESKLAVVDRSPGGSAAPSALLSSGRPYSRSPSNFSAASLSPSFLQDGSAEFPLPTPDIGSVQSPHLAASHNPYFPIATATSSVTEPSPTYDSNLAMSAIPAIIPTLKPVTITAPLTSTPITITSRLTPSAPVFKPKSVATEAPLPPLAVPIVVPAMSQSAPSAPIAIASSTPTDETPLFVLAQARRPILLRAPSTVASITEDAEGEAEAEEEEEDDDTEGGEEGMFEMDAYGKEADDEKGERATVWPLDEDKAGEQVQPKQQAESMLFRGSVSGWNARKAGEKEVEEKQIPAATLKVVDDRAMERGRSQEALPSDKWVASPTKSYRSLVSRNSPRRLQVGLHGDDEWSEERSFISDASFSNPSDEDTNRQAVLRRRRAQGDIISNPSEESSSLPDDRHALHYRGPSHTEHDASGTSSPTRIANPNLNSLAPGFVLPGDQSSAPVPFSSEPIARAGPNGVPLPQLVSKSNFNTADSTFSKAPSFFTADSQTSPPVPFSARLSAPPATSENQGTFNRAAFNPAVAPFLPLSKMPIATAAPLHAPRTLSIDAPAFQPASVRGPRPPPSPARPLPTAPTLQGSLKVPSGRGPGLHPPDPESPTHKFRSFKLPLLAAVNVDPPFPGPEHFNFPRSPRMGASSIAMRTTGFGGVANFAAKDDAADDYSGGLRPSTTAVEASYASSAQRYKRSPIPMFAAPPPLAVNEVALPAPLPAHEATRLSVRSRLGSRDIGHSLLHHGDQPSFDDSRVRSISISKMVSHGLIIEDDQAEDEDENEDSMSITPMTSTNFARREATAEEGERAEPSPKLIHLTRAGQHNSNHSVDDLVKRGFIHLASLHPDVEDSLVQRIVSSILGERNLGLRDEPDFDLIRTCIEDGYRVVCERTEGVLGEALRSVDFLTQQQQHPAWADAVAPARVDAIHAETIEAFRAQSLEVNRLFGEVLARVEGQSRKLSDLASRQQHMPSPTHVSPVDVGAIVREVVDSLSPRLEKLHSRTTELVQSFAVNQERALTKDKDVSANFVVQQLLPEISALQDSALNAASITDVVTAALAAFPAPATPDYEGLHRSFVNSVSQTIQTLLAEHKTPPLDTDDLVRKVVASLPPSSPPDFSTLSASLSHLLAQSNESLDIHRAALAAQKTTKDLSQSLMDAQTSLQESRASQALLTERLTQAEASRGKLEKEVEPLRKVQLTVLEIKAERGLEKVRSEHEIAGLKENLKRAQEERDASFKRETLFKREAEEKTKELQKLKLKASVLESELDHTRRSSSANQKTWNLFQTKTAEKLETLSKLLDAQTTKDSNELRQLRDELRTVKADAAATEKKLQASEDKLSSQRALALSTKQAQADLVKDAARRAKDFDGLKAQLEEAKAKADAAEEGSCELRRELEQRDRSAEASEDAARGLRSRLIETEQALSTLHAEVERFKQNRTPTRASGPTSLPYYQQPDAPPQAPYLPWRSDSQKTNRGGQDNTNGSSFHPIVAHLQSQVLSPPATVSRPQPPPQPQQHQQEGYYPLSSTPSRGMMGSGAAGSMHAPKPMANGAGSSPWAPVHGAEASIPRCTSAMSFASHMTRPGTVRPPETEDGWWTAE